MPEELQPLENAVLLPYSRIRPNPDQPRQIFDEVGLIELGESIREHGLLQPLSVRHEPSRYDGTPYIIVAGERRWRASEGVLELIPCIIQNVDAATADVLSLIENVQRQDLTPLEEANALQKMMISQNLSQSKVAKKLGFTTGWVTNRLALLKTGDDVKAVAEIAPQSMSSLLLADKVKEPETRASILSDIADGAVYTEVKARVVAHESALEAQKKANELASRAPDAETQSRVAANSRGESSGMSRGQRVTGVSKKEADEHVSAALKNLEAWLPHASDKMKEQAETLAKRIVRADGDLGRKRYV